MIRSTILLTSLLGLAALATVGCHQPGTDMADTMRSERPTELDHLDMFLGEWEYTVEEQEAGSEEVTTATGTDAYRWACDGRVLVNETTATEAAESFEGLMILTWDPGIRKYRFSSFSSSGGTGSGTVTYDQDAKTWHFEGKGENPAIGKTRRFEGAIKFQGANAYTFSGSRWDAWKLRKLGEFKGEAQRK